jgi:hypothetical protein
MKMTICHSTPSYEGAAVVGVGGSACELPAGHAGPHRKGATSWPQAEAVQQVDIRRASFRTIHHTPGHVTFGVWVNGGKCGDLVVRVEEEVAFVRLLERTFQHLTP